MGTGFHVFGSLPQLMLMAVLNCLFDSLSQMLRYVCASGIFLKYYITWNKHFRINETCSITLQEKCGEEGFIGEYGGPFSSSGWDCWWRVSKNETFKMFLIRHGWEKRWSPGWMNDALLPPSGWFWRATPSKWCTVWPSEYVVLSSQKYSTLSRFHHE